MLDYYLQVVLGITEVCPRRRDDKKPSYVTADSPYTSNETNRKTGDMMYKMVLLG
jgi:hypothetical protein